MKPDEIKPEHNPWYLLATLHGEAGSADDEVHSRNRMTWNRFMAAELTEDAREFLINERVYSAEEVVPFTAEELSEVERLFTERNRQAKSIDRTPLPDLKGEIDFSNAEFNFPFSAKGFLFPSLADFSDATFFWADFHGAVFSSGAIFRGATFSGGAVFSAVTFSGRVDFMNATFSYCADFENATFSGEAVFSAATFSGATDFRRATFSDRVNFVNATFSDITAFENATLSGGTDFRRATFSDSVDFMNATFSDITDFENATFSGEAVFLSATFSDVAAFLHATFSGGTDFERATFEENAMFVNAEMRGPTSFENAKFLTAPPQFSEAKLHQGTVWRGVPPWPLPSDPKEAGSFVDAYACLKLEMDRLKKHEDELDFFALELQSRRVLDGDWQQVRLLEIPAKTITTKPRKLFGRSFTLPSFTIKAQTFELPRPAPGLAIALYGGLSDYGRSYVRPLCWLLATVLVGILPFWWHLSGFFSALGLSLANTFGVLGFRRELLGPEILTLPGWLKAVAAAQTVAGIVLLFLVGLAIRNRFRMK